MSYYDDPDDVPNVDREFERKIRELWMDQYHILEGLKLAIHRDDVLTNIQSVHAYSNAEDKAEVMDLILNKIGEYMSDEATRE